MLPTKGQDLVVGDTKWLKNKLIEATNHMFHKCRVEIWSRGMFVTLGERWVGPKQPSGLTPKVTTIIPGSPIALEGIPPTDWLLKGIMWLSPTLAGSLRNVVAHVAGNMEDEGLIIEFSTVQWLFHVWLFATPWTTALQGSLSITNSQSPPKPMSIESVMPSNHHILCHPLLLLPSIFPRIFSNESALHIRWPKYWRCSFNISLTNEHPGLIFFRMTGWISMQSKGLSRVFSNTQFKSINSSALSFFYSQNLTSIYDHWKNHSLD